MRDGDKVKTPPRQTERETIGKSTYSADNLVVSKHLASDTWIKVKTMTKKEKKKGGQGRDGQDPISSVTVTSNTEEGDLKSPGPHGRILRTADILSRLESSLSMVSLGP